MNKQRRGVLVGCLGAIALGCAGAGVPESVGSKSDRVKAQPVGKVQAPVDVASNVTGEVVEEAFPVSITLTPQVNCIRITSVVRGVDGVVVESTPQQHPRCVRGEGFTHLAHVRVPDRVAGYLVVDVAMELSNGQGFTRSKAFSLRRPNASVQAKQGPPMTRDAEGNPIILMPAVSSP